MVSLEELLPCAIADRAGTLGRLDDVGKQHRREDAVVLGGRPDAGQELLDLVEDRARVAEIGKMVHPRELHELRPLDLVGQVASLTGIAIDVVSSLKHQGWRADRRQDRTDIDLGIHPEIRECIAGTVGEALVPAPPIAERFVVDPGRGNLGEKHAGSPGVIDQPSVVLHPFGAATPWIAFGRAGPRVRPVQDQGPRSLRV